MDSLFKSHHSLTLDNSWLIKFCNSTAFEEDTKILVSSANILKENLSEQLGISLMYSGKRRGPRELPCGIPNNNTLLPFSR